MKKITDFKFWCQEVLPLVYDDSLSYYEVLCKFSEKLNDVINNINLIPDYIRSLVTDEELGIILSQLLDELREQIASANEGTSETATSDRNIGELVWLNGILVKIIKNMDAGDKYVNGSNYKPVTVEELLTEIQLSFDEKLELLKNKFESDFNSIKDDYVNILNFGADNTGNNDCTEALVNALASNPNCTVFFPCGTYKFDNAINISGTHGIKGSGFGETRLIFNNSTGDCLKFVDWRCFVEDLSIVAKTNGYVICFENSSSSSYVNNCIIECINGIKIHAVLNRVSNCAITCPNGIGIDTGSNDSSQIITYTTIGSGLADKSDTGSGIVVNGGNCSLAISYCNILLKNSAININATSNIFSLRIINNFLDNSNTCGISISGNAKLYRSTIKGNWIGASPLGINNYGTGGVDGLTLEDNEFFILTSSCINLANSSNIIIRDNVAANGAVFVNALSSMSNIKIINNVIGDYGGEGKVTTGISFYGGVPANGCYVIDNDLTGCTTAIFGSPGSTVFRDNIGYTG